MKSFNNSYGSLGILCLSNVLGFKLDMKVNSLGCTLFAWPWRFLETLWSPSDYSWIGAGNRWIPQDALSYYYVTNPGNPSHSSFWSDEQLDAIINLFKVFWTRERVFGNLATVYSTCNSHPRFLLKSKCNSAYKLNMEILILRLVLCLLGALFIILM